ncbi:hypothetical protein QOZ80_9AG0687410 [Eleusine coracana subsp. coracana]|nr:hypothetical protein QOZ80_9AG0687410 [Eleusine coracana subsp. coracana]
MTKKRRRTERGRRCGSSSRRPSTTARHAPQTPRADAMSSAGRWQRLEERIALITGGVSGLGKATAEEFIKEGTTAIVIAHVNSELGLITVDELGLKDHFVPCNVTVEESVAAAVDATITWHVRLNVMLNSASITGPLTGTSRVASLDLAAFNAVMAVNMHGMLAGIKHATRVMAPAGAGLILCLVSLSRILGGLGTYPYSVSKFAVVGIVKAVVAELSRLDVHVNCISPYAVPTLMVVEKFMTLMQSVADEVRLLLNNL